MNEKQRLVLKICAAVIVAMMIYPPIQVMGRSLGHHWVFAKNGYEGTGIDAGVLLVQWLGVCLVGGIAFALAKNSPDGGFLDPGQSSKLASMGAFLAIAVMRLARAGFLIFFVVGCLAFVGDVFSLMGVSASQNSDPGKLSALLLMKCVGLGFLMGISSFIRVFINRLHTWRTGSPGALLQSWRNL